MADYKVVTAALRAEAKMWQEHADKARPIVDAVRETYLTAPAFFVGDVVSLIPQSVNAKMLADEYEEFRSFVENILRGAVAEFDQIDVALRKIADEYDKAEEVVEIDLDQAYHV